MFNTQLLEEFASKYSKSVHVHEPSIRVRGNLQREYLTELTEKAKFRRTKVQTQNQKNSNCFND
jgi:hypothetical protein